MCRIARRYRRWRRRRWRRAWQRRPGNGRLAGLLIATAPDICEAGEIYDRHAAAEAVVFRDWAVYAMMARLDRDSGEEALVRFLNALPADLANTDFDDFTVDSIQKLCLTAPRCEADSN